mgnify:CR=1 FL=1
MLKNLVKKKKRAFLLALLVSFFGISIVSTGFLLMFLSQSNTLKQTEIRTAEESTVNTVTYFVTYKINRLTSDLEFVSDILLDHYPGNRDFSDVASIWLAYSNRRTVYDQIRYLDLEGNEIIRINYSADGSYVVPQDQLQNKKDRYYFQDSLSLEKNQISISQFDLNVENNQIEQPIKPMLRLGTPFFDAAGKKAGVVVLNYAAMDILQQVKTISTTNVGNLFLLNSEGYWLFNQNDPQKEWAFMFDPNSSVSFASEYPEEWSAMQSSSAGTVQTKNGSFCYAKLLSGDMFQSGIRSGAIFSQAGDWYVVSMIPNTSPDWQYFSNQIGDLLLYIVQRYYVFYIVFLGVAFVLSALYAGNLLKKEEVQYYAEYDVMTGVYNRNAGIRCLNALYKSLSKNSCVTSICFLDVNGLKEVNDVLGHESGDELLITVTSTIRSNIRANDFVIRLGGDEFVIVFTGVDETLAEQAWGRIVAAFDAINNAENRPYVVSVSHGIQEINCGVDRMLDSILQQADEKMYEEKRKIKSNIRILR